LRSCDVGVDSDQTRGLVWCEKPLGDIVEKMAKWYYGMGAHGKCNVLGFTSAEGYFGLKFTNPVNRTA